MSKLVNEVADVDQEVMRQIQDYEKILVDIFPGGSGLIVLQECLIGDGTQLAGADPLLKIVGNIRIAKMRNRTNGLIANFAAGLTVDVAAIVGGSAMASKVTAALADGDPRSVQQYAACGAEVFAEVLNLQQMEEFWQFTPAEISNSFISRILQPQGGVAIMLNDELAVLLPAEMPAKPDLVLNGKIATGLNNLLSQQNIFNKARFAGVKLPRGLAEQLEKPPGTHEYAAINRRLIEAAFPRDFSRREKILNFIAQRPELRAKIVIADCFTWLAKRKITTFESLCIELGLSSPNMVTVSSTVKSAINKYDKLPPIEKEKFRTELKKSIPSLNERSSPKELVSLAQVALTTGSEIDRQEFARQLRGLVAQPDLQPVNGAAGAGGQLPSSATGATTNCFQSCLDVRNEGATSL